MKLIHSNFETVSISALKDVAKRAGSCWFDKGTLNFFKSKLPRTTMFYRNDRYSDVAGRYFFISSEQFQDQPRKYTVRSMQVRAIKQEYIVDRFELDIYKVCEFQEFDTRAEAKKALVEYINSQPRID